MNEVVERVAKAIWLNAPVRGERSPAQWDEFLAWYKDGAHNSDSCVHHSTIGLALESALAAIKAMREPSEAMETAGEMMIEPLRLGDNTHLHVWSRNARASAVWAAMIDAILSDPIHRSAD